jgi:hypothetical protein
MSTFLRDHPEAKSHVGVVLLSEDVHSFKFTKRQAARYPNQTFAVALAPFRSVTTESDTSVLEAPLLFPFGRDLRSEKSFPAMFDGVIWIPDAKQWALKQPYEYLPEQCK